MESIKDNKRLSLCQSVIFSPLCRSRVHLSVSCVCYGELSLKATLSVSFKDKFVENISKEREEASCLLLHDMWPSVAISDFFPLVRHIEVWHCGSGWCCCSRKVPEPNSHVAFVPLFRNFPSSEPTAATVCIVCAGIQLHWRHLRGHALPCLPKKTVPVIAAHSPQIIIESVPRHFQTSLNLSRLPLLLRNCSRLRLFQLSRFGQEVQFYQGFTR